jgi:hypothetical protein
MFPLDASKSFDANDAAPFVDPSAAAFWIESVPAANESGEETLAEDTTPEPFA